MRWLGVGAALALIWWSSSTSPTGQAPSTWRALLHNVAHVVAFFSIAALVELAIAGARLPERRAARMTVTVAATYGAIDELHQSFVPGRVCSVGDWLTDVCGACLAVVVVSFVHEPTAARRRGVAGWLCAALAMACAATWLPI
ncbi:MAG: VanZ family protein [Planctomycetes bacterium]|nr:VanZ family protein [Planctomycetota bacterium]